MAIRKTAKRIFNPQRRQKAGYNQIPKRHNVPNPQRIPEHLLKRLQTI